MTDIELPIVVALSKPVEHGGKTYDEVVIAREPIVGDLAAMDPFAGQATASAAALIASLADMPVQAVKKILARDFAVISARLEPLLGNASPGVSGPT